MYKKIIVTCEGGVDRISLNDLPSLNALDLTMAAELEEELHHAEEDPSIHVVLLTGEGRAFSAGGDIRFMKAHVDEPDFVEKSMAPLARKISEIILFMKKMSKIVICAVQGFAAGGGANLAFGADFIFAEKKAKFIEAFQGIGLCPDSGAAYFIPRMAGTHKALDLMVTGRAMTAEEAYNFGIVKELTEKDELLPRAAAFADHITQGPLLVYANTKHLMYESMYKDYENFMLAESKCIGQCARSHDFKEGVTAFLEKRRPKFEGQ